MTNAALSLDTVRYEKTSDWARKKIPLVKNVSLDVHAGESFGFLGHNGAGKTTTIKCILDLIRHQSGTIRIFGVDSTRTEARASVGFLPEQPYFYDNLTVDETLRMYGALVGLTKEKLSRRVAELTELLGLEAKRKSRMRSLSKGLTQRVGLAQAVIGEPLLLILDEPFSGLDPIGRKEFRDILLDLKRKGTTLFMSSHILSDVEHLCDRASILVRGELKGVYEMKNLPRSSASTYELLVIPSESVDKLAASLRSRSIACEIINHQTLTALIFTEAQSASDGLKEAVDSGCKVVSYQEHGGTLEDLFISVAKS